MYLEEGELELLESEKDKRSVFWKRWSLLTKNGQQVWKYKEASNRTENDLNELSQAFIFRKEKNSNSADKVYRHSKLEHSGSIEVPEWMNQSVNFSCSRTQKTYKAAYKGVHFYSKLQSNEGHWPGDYGGPLFLLPALVFTSYITEAPFSEEKRVLMSRYMLNHQNSDGGWGLHIEGNSTMFGTVMQYCALRLLGHSKNQEELVKARAWILEHGGALNTPSWGKFFLSVLGVMEWKGCNSLLPELWLLPKWVPIHPWRYWCHARMVYLPMSYCFGLKVKSRSTELIKELKSEIYKQNYETIKWGESRNNISETDRFKPAPKGLKILLKILNLYEKIALKPVRKKAVQFALDYVEAEDEQTKSIDIGPVNQIINSLCIWKAYGKDSIKFKKHVDRWSDYLWLAEDGLKMNGYNGSQLWDTAFAVQAMLENLPENKNEEALAKAYQYIDYSQIKEEVEDREKFFRHRSVGGWPFSTLDHGWPISDCTAEGLKATLGLHKFSVPELYDLPKISEKRLKKAADLILSFQNDDGGWATYENTRGSSWLEYMNPSEVFGKIMVDYSWTECTSACITALIEFQKSFPEYATEEINKSIERGIEFILSQQRTDGSWVGNWGVCFTYGIWFAVEALTKYRQNFNGLVPQIEQAINSARKFLLVKQLNDGGWGESYLSCSTDSYQNHKESQIINTSWALLSLMEIEQSNSDSIKKGIDFLISMQEESGDWPQQSISGVFNQNCMITYTSYRNVFPIWALGRYTQKHAGKVSYRK